MNADGSNAHAIYGSTSADWVYSWQPVPNSPPATSNDTVSLAANTTASADVLANDTDEEALPPSNLIIKTVPTHWTSSIKDGKIFYTPAKDFVGSDQLAYQICDSFLLDQKCATGVLGIVITAGPAPAIPTITSVGTVQMHGVGTVYYTGHRPTFTGTAEPGAAIKVGIHSAPIILTTTVVGAGNWSVTPTQDIPNGEHQVIITATKDGATSAPLNLVLGINTGLAETGVPVWPLSVAGLIGLLGARGAAPTCCQGPPDRSQIVAAWDYLK